MFFVLHKFTIDLNGKIFCQVLLTVWIILASSQENLLVAIFDPIRHKPAYSLLRLAMHRVQRRMFSVDNFFRIFKIIFFCFEVAIYDLVHDVETIFHLS